MKYRQVNFYEFVYKNPPSDEWKADIHSENDGYALLLQPSTSTILWRTMSRSAERASVRY